MFTIAFSPIDPSVVWSTGYLSQSSALFVSTDGGATFRVAMVGLEVKDHGDLIPSRHNRDRVTLVNPDALRIFDLGSGVVAEGVQQPDTQSAIARAAMSPVDENVIVLAHARVVVY
jgi:hypothetical protein